MAEPLSIFALIHQLIFSVNQVVQLFDSIENAPREMRLFHNSIRLLERDMELLDKAIKENIAASKSLDSEQSKFPDVEQVQETVTRSIQVFEKATKSLKQPLLGNIVWTVRWARDVAQCQRDIERDRREVVNARWPVILYDMIRTLNPMAGSNQIPHAPEEPLGPPAAFARSTEPNSPIQEERRTSLFTYGLANEEPIDEVGIEWPEHWDQVPGTLHLDARTVEARHKQIELDRVQVMFRNKTSRILHFENADRSIRVKHVVPLEAVPFTSDLKSNSTTFYGSHVVTVIEESDTGSSHHVYNNVKDPVYRFSSVKTRRSFQSIARERTLKQEFYAMEIAAPEKFVEDGGVIARCQVVSLWSRHPEPWISPSASDASVRIDDDRSLASASTLTGLPNVTMSFLAPRLDNGKTHQEIDLSDFRHDPYIVSSSRLRLWNRSQSSNGVELQPSNSSLSDWGRIRLKFGSVAEAGDFRKRFMRLYPKYSNTAPPKLILELPP